MTVFYSGRVQGVGFRFGVCEVARGFAVSGCVENLGDGRVRLVAEGEEGVLRGFLDVVGRGLVWRREVFWSEGTGEFDGFGVVGL